VRFVFTPPADHAAGLLTLPWSQPLSEWRDERLVEIRQRGISRHVVRFICDDGTLYALKELNERLARREYRLLRALAELLVRLHLSGFFWGDCSLSNTLYRHDAGTLEAYLVDAETSEQHPELTAGQRRYDLELAVEQVSGELLDLQAGGLLPADADPRPAPRRSGHRWLAPARQPSSRMHLLRCSGPEASYRHRRRGALTGKA
jgi:hypothetical protein